MWGYKGQGVQRHYAHRNRFFEQLRYVMRIEFAHEMVAMIFDRSLYAADGLSDFFV
jgi:hypothetical protein